MTEVFIDRFKSDENGTFGGMTDDEGLLPYNSVFTVEPPATGDHPCIPAGSYQVEPYNSPVHGKVWILLDVPGRSFIEIHPANIASQLKGCIAPGNALGKLSIGGRRSVTAVLNSHKTLKMLKHILPDKFTLTITDVEDEPKSAA